jgi:hypothetical protein
MNLLNLTPTQLRKAATLKEQIEKLQSQLESITGSTASSNLGGSVNPGKRKMSAASIAKIRAAAKARWAAIKAKSASSSTGAAPRPVRKKRTISAAGIARIKAAQKARWAAFKAKAGKPAPKTGKK